MENNNNKENKMEHINWQILLENSHYRSALAEEMLGMLAVDLPKLQSSINAAFQNAQWEELKNFIHLLHGSSNWCSITKLKSLSAALEVLLDVSGKLAVKPKKEILHLITEINMEITIVLKLIETRAYLPQDSEKIE